MEWTVALTAPSNPRWKITPIPHAKAPAVFATLAAQRGAASMGGDWVQFGTEAMKLSR